LVLNGSLVQELRKSQVQTSTCLTLINLLLFLQILCSSLVLSYWSACTHTTLSPGPSLPFGDLAIYQYSSLLCHSYLHASIFRDQLQLLGTLWIYFQLFDPSLPP
jgi:hypothetical protein